MTEYSNVINCGRTLRNILVIANKKSLELIAKRIKLTVKRTIEIFGKVTKQMRILGHIANRKVLCRNIFLCDY